ncbi:MAG: hypothetical protein ABSF38_07785, partial [Verrucomicrobiota bacterium]
MLTAVGIPANRIILSDLCPNSIVKRIVADNRRQDDSRQPVKDRAPIFCRYVEHPVVEEWTWRRNTESWSECIVVLGSIAEHGLLRLLISGGAKITCHVPPVIPPNLSHSIPPCWVDRPADPGRNLRYWLEPGRWWTISIPGRNIRLLPIYHPVRMDDNDPGYERTAQALAARGAGQNSSLSRQAEGVIAFGVLIEPVFPELVQASAAVDAAQ